MATPLIKPQQIDTLPFLDEERKVKYKTALQNLWNNYEAAPKGTPQHADFEQKLKNASNRIMQELGARNGRAGAGAGGAQQQQRPPQQQQQQQQSGQMGGQPTQQQGGGMQAQASAGQGAQGQPQGNGLQSVLDRGVQLNLTPSSRETLMKIQVHVPSSVQPAQHAAYRGKWFAAAADLLAKREKAMSAGRQMQQRQQQMQQQGQDVPPQMMVSIENARRTMQETETNYKKMLGQNEAARVANQQAPQQQQQAQGQGQQAGQGQQQHSQQQVNGAQDMQRSASSNAQNAIKQEARTSMSPPQPQGGFQQQQQQPTQQQQQAAPQNQQQNMAQQPTPQQSHQTPQSATQPQAQQNFPQNPQQQYQQRPQINTQLSQNQIAQAQQQHPGTPNPTVPQSAVQQSQQQQQQASRAPQALSQQAAMAQAASEYQRGQQQQAAMARQQQTPGGHPGQQPQIPNNMPFNAPPSASQATPNSTFPNQPQQQQQPTPGQHHTLQATSGQTPTNKFPIKPTMQLNPQLTAPVPGPPSRPTMANQSMTQQPGLVRPQPFTLEGEGDRVLSKRKLDELVRQVTGGGEDGSLSPDVEESMLTLADDFVDNVITSACRLAKLRQQPNSTLDIRDVQLVLERNYGIRIPGFALDEVRTVRKFAPAAGWQSKMQAVQTAKTLGGVGKGDA